jgi:uncharacterized repeat protein (TIGR01451 family)
MMLLVKARHARALSNHKVFGTKLLRYLVQLLIVTACLAGPLASHPAQAAYNLLTNGDFETPVVANVNGNNLTGTNWGSWTSGNQLNPIRVNGAGYGSGADNAYSGSQYLDILGQSTVYQSFVLPSPRTIYFGAAFSNRESALGAYIPSTDQVSIYNSFGTLVATSNAVSLTSAMGDEVWVASSGTATLPAGTYNFVISLGDYSHVDAAYVKTTTVTIQKITDYGVGGPFTFTQTNLASNPASITTTGTGTAAPTSPIAVSVTTLGAAVTISEANNTAFTLTTFTCSDANSAFTGNPASFVSISGYTFTILASAIVQGADIICVSRSSKFASITVTKISNGGTGSFSFLGTNGWGPQTITTTTSGLGAAGPEAFINVINVATTISESVPSDYVVTAITCTGLNSGGTAAYNVAGGSVTLSSQNFGFGATLACTFTNAKKPTITITNVSNNGVGPFTFTGTNGWSSQTITTVTSGVGVTGAKQTLTTASTGTSISEGIPATFKLDSINCTGLGSGGTATVNLASGSVLFNAAATPLLANIVCTFTNAKLIPSMTVVKSASTAGPVAVGTVITYTYVVRNTGNTTISNVAVGETFNGHGTIPAPRGEVLSLDVVPLNDSTDVTANNGIWSVLSPGDQLTFTAPYTVTQADIDLLQ